MLNRNQLADYNTRRRVKNGGLIPAHSALAATRRADELGKISPYASARSNPWRVIGDINPATSDGTRWVENPEGAGLRFVGYADDLARLDHRGWFLDDEIQDETARGAVYQLPARNGRAQYVPAMVHSHNDGAAMFDFSNIHQGEPGGEESHSRYDRKAECARAADSIAENYAEKAREYQRAWRAGTDYADKGEEMPSLRRQIRAQVQAIREHGGPGETFIRASFADTLCGLWEELQQLREDRANLRAQHDNPHDRDAFNDGAGIA